jgi:hypothetical protein
VFQNHHLPPDEVFAKPKKVRLFMYASDDIVAEEIDKQQRKGGKNNGV